MKPILNIFLIPVFICTSTAIAVAQNPKQAPAVDTIRVKYLDSILLNSYISRYSTHLPDVDGVNIYSGKRTNKVLLAGKEATLAQNLGRTAFAKIPGLTMWEMDGAGTQLNIGSRGTDPHRSIEMNMRQNGYNTNSDVFGYPENHYNVPLQGVEEVQLVRGSAALQFGPQFGGMMNYKMKSGDSTRSLKIESEQTTGSNGLFNSYNAVGGNIGRWNYYSFYAYRHTNGWRDNARMDYHSMYAHLGYRINKKGEIAAEFSRMQYVQQIAGGLTDQQFMEEPGQSFRKRNFFQPIINIPALLFNYEFSANTRLAVSAHGLFGERSSVQFINAGNIPDTFNTGIGSFNPRQVDRDFYRGFTTEARVLHKYHVRNLRNVLSGGIRYYNSLTRRRQKGTGTTDSDFDLSLTKPYGIDLHLRTQNYALFAENLLYLTDRLRISPGMRFEIIRTSLEGVINNGSSGISYRGDRTFPLFGTGLQYSLNNTMELYGNFSQAYRPYLYSNVTPADRIDKIDPDLKDSRGYDADLGFRGHYKNLLRFDVNVFYLYYGNRIGLVSQPDGTGGNYLFTTNTGNSVTRGIELFIEWSLMRWLNRSLTDGDLRIYHSMSYNDAHYVSGTLNQAGTNKSIRGNMIENAPAWVSKTGLEFSLRHFALDLQYSYTSRSYNDAFNTENSSNGVIGLIPAYHVWDFSGQWLFAPALRISAGVNNFTNEKYFNRRITFYPGPGILPADGRTFYVSLGVKI